MTCKNININITKHVSNWQMSVHITQVRKCSAVHEDTNYKIQSSKLFYVKCMYETYNDASHKIYCVTVVIVLQLMYLCQSMDTYLSNVLWICYHYSNDKNETLLPKLFVNWKTKCDEYIQWTDDDITQWMTRNSCCFLFHCKYYIDMC